MRKVATGLAVLAALACVSSIRAHHSGYMYQTTPFWISGEVVRIELKNPHTIMTLEDRSENGQVRLWAVEGPSQTELDRTGADAPRAGDTIEVCAFPYKSADEITRDARITPPLGASARQWLSVSATDGSSPRFVAGHVLVTGDGQMRPWEPHGIIAECIRSSNDERQPWVDFLNASPRARELWCQQKRYTPVQSNAPLRQLVEELDRLLDDPC
jgi:hypothetical protein